MSASETVSALLFMAIRGVAIPLVAFDTRKWRQPGFAADCPEFIGWLQLILFVKSTKVHFNFIGGSREDGRTTFWAEVPASKAACFAFDSHGILREHCGSVEERAMVLAAIETVANAYPVWRACCNDSDTATEAAASDCVHSASTEIVVVAVRPTVRAKRATAVGRQARATENVHRTCGPGLVARR